MAAKSSTARVGLLAALALGVAVLASVWPPVRGDRNLANPARVAPSPTPSPTKTPAPKPPPSVLPPDHWVSAEIPPALAADYALLAGEEVWAEFLIGYGADVPPAAIAWARLAQTDGSLGVFRKLLVEATSAGRFYALAGIAVHDPQEAASLLDWACYDLEAVATQAGCLLDWPRADDFRASFDAAESAERLAGLAELHAERSAAER